MPIARPRRWEKNVNMPRDTIFLYNKINNQSSFNFTYVVFYFCLHHVHFIFPFVFLRLSVRYVQHKLSEHNFNDWFPTIGVQVQAFQSISIILYWKENYFTYRNNSNCDDNNLKKMNRNSLKHNNSIIYRLTPKEKKIKIITF